VSLCVSVRVSVANFYKRDERFHSALRYECSAQIANRIHFCHPCNCQEERIS
jgi:hypothetical protein